MHSKRRQKPSSASASSTPPIVPHHHPHHPHPHHHHPHHLQPVQDDDLRRLNLPPSIPVSRDGEEGATVYNLRLHQSNVDAKPDCYQAPPNRTVFPADDPLAAAASTASAASSFSVPAVLSHHSTSTPSLKQIGAPTSPTMIFNDASKFRSTKQQQQQQHGRMLPTHPTRLTEAAAAAAAAAHRHHHHQHHHPGGGVGDYVSGSLLSSWRTTTTTTTTTSPDRWMGSPPDKSIIIPMGPVRGLPSPPPLPHIGQLPGGGGGTKPPSGLEDDPLNGRRSGTVTKQRSSSADSVRRLVAKCSLLRFTRKQTTTTKQAPKPSTSGVLPLAVDPTRKQQLDEQLDEGQTPGGGGDGATKDDQEAPPWELPPNYVDMIFTKDPPTTTTTTTLDANKKGNVIKQQQQQQQQHQEKQQRQQQHCCFNS